MRSIPRLEGRSFVSLACASVGWLLVTLCAGGCPELPSGPRFVGAGHKTPQHGGTLVLWEESRVRTLDPHIAFDEVSGVIVKMVFEPLYRYDRDMNLQPAVAAALPDISEDGKTLRIKLRQDVRFHHGRALRADDVAWTFERLLHPDTRSIGAAYYTSIRGVEAFREGKTEHVEGIRVLGPYEIAFELIKPDQSFVHRLAMAFSSPIPREIVQERGDQGFARRPSGTGPYRLVRWESGVQLVLERNPTYREKGLPYVDRVVFYEDLAKETAFLRFRNGEVDIVPRITPPDLSYLRNGRWKDYVAESARADVFALGMNVEMEPFDNVHLRRAVAFAIDRERWAKARNYTIRPTGQLLPPAIAGYDPNLPHRQYLDLTRAKQEMALAGYPDGYPEPIPIWGTTSVNMRRYLELAQADLDKIGIKIQPKLVSFPVYLEQTGKPKTAPMLALGWVMDYPDASNFLEVVSSKTKAAHNSTNRAFFSTPELDALLDRALVERDPKKRVAMYREANDYVADQAPWAFFCNQVNTQAWQPYVHGYRPHPAYWMPVNEVWLDLPKKRIAELYARDAIGGRSFAGLTPFAGLR